MQTISGLRGSGRTTKLAALVANDFMGFMIVTSKEVRQWVAEKFTDCRGRIFTVDQVIDGAHLGRGFRNAYIDDSDTLDSTRSYQMRRRCPEIAAVVVHA